MTRQPLPTTSLFADDVGVRIQRSDQAEPIFIRWDDIDEIQTFKLDLLTTDDIRLTIHIANGWYELSETDAGFMDVVAAMQRHFPSISENWYFEVMQPPFATNERVLWSSRSHPGN